MHSIISFIIMGVTRFSLDLIEEILQKRKIESVMDLGAQNNFAQPHLPAPYMREWWETRNVKYDSIDLNGECGAYVLDLSLPLVGMEHDLVMDFGTGEHISDDRNSYGTGKFSLQHFYQFWLNKFNLCKVGGLILSENPKTGNWPGHGFNYLTQEFYTKLCFEANLKFMYSGEHPAMNNHIDGWNIYSLVEKKQDEFISFDLFKTLDIRQS